MDGLVGMMSVRLGGLDEGLDGQPELYRRGQRTRRPAKRSPYSTSPAASSTSEPSTRRLGGDASATLRGGDAAPLTLPVSLPPTATAPGELGEADPALIPADDAAGAAEPCASMA